jgi:hypothetical protein
MDGLPAALLAAQQALQAATQREAALRAKLDHLVKDAKTQRKALGAAQGKK